MVIPRLKFILLSHARKTIKHLLCPSQVFFFMCAPGADI